MTTSPAALRLRPELGSPVAWHFPDFAETALGNGLRLLTLHRPGKQVATVAAVLDVPADADPAGRVTASHISGSAAARRDTGTSRVAVSPL